MKFFFIATSSAYGGMEHLFIEMSRFLCNNDNSVYFITRNSESIYYNDRVLNENVNFNAINLNFNKPIQYTTENEMKQIKEKLELNNFSNIGKHEECYVITSSFDDFQLAISIFGHDYRFKLMHLWGHPEEWKNVQKLHKNAGMTNKKIKNSMYYYQRKLIKLLYEKNADFYSGRVVPVFINWYYELKIYPKDISVLPIQSINKSIIDYNIIKGKINLNILWCGRFDYWKDEAIIHIHTTLEKLAKYYTNIVINYYIIGFGRNENTNYVKESINPVNVNVNYIGEVKSEELSKMISKYDIGIGMGLSVKKMGQVGLPSIVIDSVDKEHSNWLKADWLFNTKEGDAGDGYYFHIAGKKIEGRKDLYELLDEVFKEPLLLNDYSKRCLDYVNENYSEGKQIEKIINRVLGSQFCGINYPIYRRNICLRLMYRLYKNLNRLLKRENEK